MPPKHRILMLCPEYPPLGGGAANACQYLLQEFASLKHLQIDLITASTDKQYSQKLHPNCQAYFLNIKKNNQNLHYQSQTQLLSWSFQAYRLTKELTKLNQYHLVHAWFTVPSGILAMNLGLPYIVALRGSDVPFYNPRFRHLDRVLFQHLAKVVWKNADQVIANSQGLKQLAQQTSPTQGISVIPNGVDTKRFFPNKSKKSSSTIQLLTVARLIPRKGIHLLFDALSRIKDTNWHLTIAGDGPEKNNLQNQARDLHINSRVTFKGLVPPSQTPKLYQQADIFILPSQNEGMSNTVLEAMASGLPVVVTKTGGTQELVQDNGIILTKIDPNYIAQQLSTYMQDKTKLTKYGNKSRKIATTMSWHKVASRYIDIYKQVRDRN